MKMNVVTGCREPASEARCSVVAAGKDGRGDVRRVATWSQVVNGSLKVSRGNDQVGGNSGQTLGSHKQGGYSSNQSDLKGARQSEVNCC